MQAAGAWSAAREASASWWHRFDPKWAVIAASVAIVVYLAAVPLGYLLWQSFLTTGTAASAAVFTLQNYRDAYYSAETARLLSNSMGFAAGTALLSFVIGTALAWINERTNTPCKSLVFGLTLIPLVIPSILFAVAWIMLASPKIGIINMLLQGWFGSDRVFVNVYSLPGMIWVEALNYSPMAFLFMVAAFRSMDPSLEESAMMSGAGVLQTFWRITLRLSWPTIFATLLILFVRSLESFEVPALLGLPVGIQVLTSSIYDAIHRYPSQIGLASAYGAGLVLITFVLILLQHRLTGGTNKYATLTGKGYRPRPIDIGKMRYVTAGLLVVYFLVVVALPFLVLVWSSLQRFYTVPSIEALQHLTLAAYRFILDYPTLRQSVWNSLALSLGCATLVMLLASVVCWIVVKTRLPGRWLLDGAASLPMVFPGLVLGLAIMIFYLNVDIGVYGTFWILLIAYVTRFLPYGLRYCGTSMLRIHKELEESAAMSGASWGAIFVRVVLPLLKPGLLAGWIYIVIVSVRELSSSILLYSPGKEVVSVVIWELWENGQYVELSALGVMLIAALFVLAQFALLAGKRFGVREI